MFPYSLSTWSKRVGRGLPVVALQLLVSYMTFSKAPSLLAILRVTLMPALTLCGACLTHLCVHSHNHLVYMYIKHQWNTKL